MQQDNIGVLQFLSGETGVLQILLVGNEHLLTPLKELVPKAKIYTIDEKEMFTSDLLNDNVTPGPLESLLDYIVVGDCFERSVAPQKQACKLREYLKPTGCIVASFYNIRHWSLLEELMSGHWRYYPQGIIRKDTVHFFAFPEIVHLFEMAKYKEVSFSVQKKPAEKKLLDKLLNCGFVNKNEDLEVMVWFVKAAKLDQTMVRLQSCFTKEVRQFMVFLLRRIENNIEMEKNCEQLCKICATESVSGEFLIALVENSMLKPEKVLLAVALYLQQKVNPSAGVQLLHEMYASYPESAKAICMVAEALSLPMNEHLMEQILSIYARNNKEIDLLLEKIRRSYDNR